MLMTNIGTDSRIKHSRIGPITDKGSVLTLILIHGPQVKYK